MFVCNNALRSVTVFNTRKREAIHDIYLELENFRRFGPNYIAISPNGKFACVTSDVLATVGVININKKEARDYKVESYFGTSSQGGGIAIAKNDFVYVSNQGTRNVTIFRSLPDFQFELIASLNIGGFPSGIDFTSDEQFALVCNRIEVVVINTATRNVVAKINTGTAPTEIVIISKGQNEFAYVTDSENNQVLVIEINKAHPEQSQVIRRIIVDTEPSGIAAPRNGQKVYVCNSRAKTVSVIDTDTNEIVKTIDVGREPIGIVIFEQP